jgi:DNA-binding SARP family transcriptional activator
MVDTARDPGVIRVRVVGAIDARDASGRTLDALLAQPRRLCLLVVLAVESMRGSCTRERLMAMFWPEHSPAQAQANLRQAIAFLRRALGEGVVVNHGRHALASSRRGSRATSSMR